MTEDSEQNKALSTSVGLSLGRRSKYSPLFESESPAEVKKVCAVLDEANIDYRCDHFYAKGALPSASKLYLVKVSPERKREGFLALQKIHGRSVMARQQRSPLFSMLYMVILPHGATGILGWFASNFWSGELGFSTMLWSVFCLPLLLLFFLSLTTPSRCSKNTCRAKLKRNQMACPQCDSKIVETLDRPKSYHL